jgi:hypothetical protein
VTERVHVCADSHVQRDQDLFILAKFKTAPVLLAEFLVIRSFVKLCGVCRAVLMGLVVLVLF